MLSFWQNVANVAATQSKEGSPLRTKVSSVLKHGETNGPHGTTKPQQHRKQGPTFTPSQAGSMSNASSDASSSSEITPEEVNTKGDIGFAQKPGPPPSGTYLTCG